MTTVAEHFVRTSQRRLVWTVGLVVAWTGLVIFDIFYGIAEREWVGLPLFLFFCGTFVYLWFMTPVRCPSCKTAIHTAWWWSF